MNVSIRALANRLKIGDSDAKNAMANINAICWGLVKEVGIKAWDFLCYLENYCQLLW